MLRPQAAISSTTMSKSSVAVASIALAVGHLAPSSPVFAASMELSHAVPDEFESAGGHSIALGNAGVVATGGTSSVRINPAMLSLESQYSVDAGYHWPTQGRDFYQAGVVDSKTSKIAAGVVYTGFTESYESGTLDLQDSPVKKRIALGASQQFSNVLSLGIMGQYVEGFELGPDTAGKKGVSLGFGVAALATPALRVGASIENLANRKVRDLAPQTMRAGGAYMLAGGDITLHVDYRRRERIQLEKKLEGTPVATSLAAADVAVPANANARPDAAEQMVIASFSTRVQDYLRLLGAYGQSLTDDRRSLSGGVALVSPKFALSYSLSRPYLESEAIHQAVDMTLSIAL